MAPPVRICPTVTAALVRQLTSVATATPHTAVSTTIVVTVVLVTALGYAAAQLAT